jgi:hypothetical protein
MANRNRLMTLAPAAISAAAILLGGCVYKTEKTTAVPATAPSPVVITPAPADRVVNYPEGRYQLYGDRTSGYYWVWIPAGTAPPTPPPPPRISVR